MAKKNLTDNSSVETAEQTKTQKIARLKKTVEAINKNAGKKVMGFISDPDIANKLTTRFIPTPSDDLNEAIGGGIPIGKITIISGKEDSGKTSMALETIALAMQNDENFTALWVETENSLELEQILNTFKIDADRFLFHQMSNSTGGETVIDEIEAILKSKSVNICVINSLKALVPKSQLHKSMEKVDVAVQARMNSEMVGKLTTVVAEADVAFILVQHLTTMIGTMSKDPYALSGGLRIRYAAHLITDHRKQSILDTDPITKEEGMKISVSIKKNHICQWTNPYKKIQYYVIYGQGTEKILTTLNKGIQQGIFRQSGAWIYMDNPDNPNEILKKWNGKASFRNEMMQNPDLFDEIRARVNNVIEDLTEEEIKLLKAEEEGTSFYEEPMQ